LVGLAILLLFFVCRESYHFYAELRHLDLPTQQTREPLGRNAHGWMNAPELAHYYQVSVEQVFAALEIEPSPGDEKISLKDLAEKYNKTPAEIEESLKKLNNPQPNRGGSDHG
jgi:hypothetical protein